MYAIVNIGGKQHRVEEKKSIYTEKLAGEEGSKVSFDEVLLVDSGKDVKVGTPTVSGVKISGKIVGHGKGDKVVVFKKKRRKGFKKKNGHRQAYSEVLIEKIGK